jgi:hypothetical protein
MKLAKLHPLDFWSTDSGLTALLVFTLVYLVVLTILSDFSFGSAVIRVFFSLILLAGVLTTFQRKWVHALAIGLAVSILIINVAEEIRPEPLIAVLNTGFSLFYLGLLFAALVFQVFRKGPVTIHRISGAIVVYLLLGVIWARLYQMLVLTLPQTFRFVDDLAGSRPDVLLRQFTYFSFITLTTTGYGDITPIHPVARLLAMFEALAGQLYLAITLARLVSLEIMHRQEKS